MYINITKAYLKSKKEIFSMRITKIHARQILDSRGNPTVEVDLFLEKQRVRASAPSGASTGRHEAHELRDHKKAFYGKGVLNAVKKINTIVAKHLRGKRPNQAEVDNVLLRLDGTPNKAKLGANAMVAVSMAVCKAGALANGLHVYEHIQKLSNTKSLSIPIPSFNIINGGKHAGNGLAFQEYMVAPKAKSFSQAMQIGSEIYHTLRKIIQKKFTNSSVGDEGGFSPPVNKVKIPFELIQEAIEKSGYTRKVRINLDAAASEFFHKNVYEVDQKFLSPDELATLYETLQRQYKIASIEDPFHEDDFVHFTKLTKKLGCQIVGDDLTVTNKKRIDRAIHNKACNALLVKLNQIGTVTETLEAIQMAKKAGWTIIVSHRSGETNDDFIADFAVGIGASQIKAGAPCRGERLAKYNQLLRIEEAKVKYSRFVL